MLTPTGSSVLSPSTMERLERIQEWGDELDQYVRSPRTIEAYRNDWRQVQHWADSFGDLNLSIPDPEELTVSLSTELVDTYVRERSDPTNPTAIAPPTLTRHLSAIRWWHHDAGLVSPTDDPKIGKRLAAIRRRVGTNKRQVKPLFLSDVRAMLSHIPDGTKGVRDRALLLVGHQTGMRRSELAALATTDLDDDPRGVVVTIQRGKTDQEGKGRKVALLYAADVGLPDELCAVHAIRAWTRLLPTTSAKVKDQLPRIPLLNVFRQVDKWGNIRGSITPRLVARVVKEYVAAIGLNPNDYAAHSLRAGCVSQSDRVGAPKATVRALTGHTSDAMLDSYARPGELFDATAVQFWGRDESLEATE